MTLTMIRPRRGEPSNAQWLAESRAANSTDVDPTPGSLTGPKITNNRGSSRSGTTSGPAMSDPIAPTVGTANTGTGGTGPSQWDIAEGLSEVGAPLYPGAVIRDRFVLVEKLGRGGMSVVYEAYDRSRGDLKDRYVDIKVLNEDAGQLGAISPTYASMEMLQQGPTDVRDDVYSFACVAYELSCRRAGE